MKALIAADADNNAKGQNGRSALHFASRKGYTDIVNILLDNGASVESRDTDYGRTPLFFAAAKGQTDVVRALVSAGADVNTQRNDGRSALSIASEEGHTEVAKMLLDNGAQIGRTPLFFAAANGDIEVVRALVSAGADVNARLSGGRAISVAWQLDISSILRSEEYKGVYDYGLTPLLTAVVTGHIDVERELVFAGADVNARLGDGCSALSVACDVGCTDAVYILLHHGAQIESKDKYGRTPLWVAAASGQTEVVHALVSAGANVNAQDNDGTSVVDVAFRKRYSDIVLVLWNNDAQMPEVGAREIVNTLIRNGAQVESRDNVYGAVCGSHIDVAPLSSQILLLFLDSPL